MKTYCKHSDPSDLSTIEKYIWQTLTCKRLCRKDYAKFVSKYSFFSFRTIQRFAKEHHTEHFIPIVHEIAKEVRERILNKNLDLPKVKYKLKTDPVSLKVRELGIESPMQQIMEHVAVGCLEELFKKKFCYYQCASIKGKGQSFGVKALQKWVRRQKFRHFGKLDVRKCFQSIEVEVVMKFLERDIRKNKLLLWFIKDLLKLHEKGLIIGSLLSQNLCNYLLSYAYRFVSSLFKERRDKRKRLIFKVLFFMDDIFLCGMDRRDLTLAVNKLISFFKEKIHLDIKSTWNIRDLCLNPIDMMGFKIKKNGKVKIRSKVFLRARKAFLNFNGSLKMSRRVSSYFGYFKRTGVKILKTFENTVNIELTKMKAADIISVYSRREILCAA